MNFQTNTPSALSFPGIWKYPRFPRRLRKLLHLHLEEWERRDKTCTEEERKKGRHGKGRRKEGKDMCEGTMKETDKTWNKRKGRREDMEGKEPWRKWRSHAVVNYGRHGSKKEGRKEEGAKKGTRQAGGRKGRGKTHWEERGEREIMVRGREEGRMTCRESWRRRGMQGGGPGKDIDGCTKNGRNNQSLLF